MQPFPFLHGILLSTVLTSAPSTSCQRNTTQHNTTAANETGESDAQMNMPSMVAHREVLTLTHQHPDVDMSNVQFSQN